MYVLPSAGAVFILPSSLVKFLPKLKDLTHISLCPASPLGCYRQNTFLPLQFSPSLLFTLKWQYLMIFNASVSIRSYSKASKDFAIYLYSSGPWNRIWFGIYTGYWLIYCLSALNSPFWLLYKNGSGLLNFFLCQLALKLCQERALGRYCKNKVFCFLAPVSLVGSCGFSSVWLLQYLEASNTKQPAAFPAHFPLGGFLVMNSFPWNPCGTSSTPMASEHFTAI